MDDSETSRRDPTVDRLARVTASYGADPARWPEDERAALQDVLTGMDAAAGQIDEEKALDRLLDLVPPPEPPPGSVDRILSAAGIEPRGASVVAFPHPPRARPVGLRFRPAIGLIAASLVLGIITGSYRVADPDFLDTNGERLVGPGDSEPAQADDYFDSDLDIVGGEERL